VDIQEKLAINKYYIDEEVHITVDENFCKNCAKIICVNICPADCFRLMNKKVSYFYEGCLECGSCRIACDKGAIHWTYPRGGFGICYEYG